MGTFTPKVHTWSNSETVRKAELAARQHTEGRLAAQNGNFQTESSLRPSSEPPA